MNLGIVGATGVIGEMVLRVLDERDVEVERLGLFASRDREPIEFRGVAVPVRAATPAALRGWDVVIFASSDDASETLAPHVIEGGGIVIDNSATFRMRPDVPLVVPEVNASAIGTEHRIFPVANCTAIVLVVALAPIRDCAGLRSVRVATYQAVSGAGRAGLDELAAGEDALFRGQPEAAPQTFAAPIARNVIPLIGSLSDDGTTGEERKVAEETRKILGLPELHVAATTVRVPVRYAHSEAVFVETERDTSVGELTAAFERAPGIVFHRDGIVTPRDVEGGDAVHVARLRSEGESRRNFMLWVVGDQTRKGAATNGVQILEVLLQRGLLRQPSGAAS